MAIAIFLLLKFSGVDLISIIEQNLGKKAEIKFFPMQPGDVKESFADITHSYNKLDYNPKVKIIEGVPSFIKWYKKFINKCYRDGVTQYGAYRDIKTF